MPETRDRMTAAETMAKAQSLYREAGTALDEDAHLDGLARFERASAIRKQAERLEREARAAGAPVVCETCGDRGFVEYMWLTGFMRGHRCSCLKGRSGR